MIKDSKTGYSFEQLSEAELDAAREILTGIREIKRIEWRSFDELRG